MNFYGDPPPSPPPGPPGPPVPKLTMKIKTAAWAPAPASDPMMDASSSEYEDNYHYSPASASAQVPQSQSEKRNYRKRITSFITDKQLRLRSYIRRRPIPFKRTQEIDTQIGTKSLIIQICRDFDECLYWGHPELVKYFLRDEGLRFTDTDSIVRTINRLEASQNKPAAKSGPKYNPFGADDDDYAPTVGEKRRREKEKLKELSAYKQAEINQRLNQELPGAAEKTRLLKSRRESLISKITETDNVCACQSFLLMVAADKEGAFYHGDPELVSKFFSEGISKKGMEKEINVRPFDQDELEYNLCSVPHCLVSRNSLAKWRQVAMEMYDYPPELPVTLHICPEKERQRWIAELDLDPNMSRNISVCSLHFKEGEPTEASPFPTEWLQSMKDPSKFHEKTSFSGKKLKTITEETKDEIEATDKASSGKGEPKVHNSSTQPKRSSTHYEQIILANRLSRKTVKKRLMEKKSSGTRIWMSKKTKNINGTQIHPGVRFRCSKRKKKLIKKSRTYFEHILASYVKDNESKVPESFKTARSQSEEAPDEDDESDLVIDESLVDAGAPKKADKRPVPGLIPINQAPPKYPIISNLTTEDKKKALTTLYPKQITKTMNPKKKYVCAVCKSVCDLFGLFVHMKQVHNGLLCQYCLKLFKKVSDLETHLKLTHGVKRKYFPSQRALTANAGANYTLACGQCNMLLRYKDVEQHSISGCKGATASKPGQVALTAKKFDCQFCDRSFGFQNQLDLHLCNGWCKGMTWLNKPNPEQTARLYKVLTAGSDLATDVAKSPHFRPQQVSVQPKIQLAPVVQPKVFNIADKTLLPKFDASKRVPVKRDPKLIEGLPSAGSIFCGFKCRGVNNHIKKELKDTGYKYDLVSKLKDANLDVGKDLEDLEITRAGKNFILENIAPPPAKKVEQIEPETFSPAAPASGTPLVTKVPPLMIKTSGRRSGRKPSDLEDQLANIIPAEMPDNTPPVPAVAPVSNKKETKNERIGRVANEIVANWEKIREAIDGFKSSCLFCQQVRYISVDTVFLLSHLMASHDLQEVTDILQEDPHFCIQRVKKQLRDCRIKDIIFNYKVVMAGVEEEENESGSQDSKYNLEALMKDGYHCCYCPSPSFSDYPGLISHIESEHNSQVLKCHLCKNIFLNYGSYLSHVCYGPPTSQGSAPRAKFCCKVCQKQDLATFLDFQSHLRKAHNICEICLVDQSSQEQLFEHCLTHSLELLCMKCRLTYDDFNAFRKHLFLSHEHEHKVCKTCHGKSWPHVYHFCIQPAGKVTCEVCDRVCRNVKEYRVHLRTHTKLKPYLCAAKTCRKSYVSRQLLWKHHIRRHPDLKANAEKCIEEKKIQKQLNIYGAQKTESIVIAKGLVEELFTLATVEKPPQQETESTDSDEDNEPNWKANDSKPKEESGPLSSDDSDKSSPPSPPAKSPEKVAPPLPPPVSGLDEPNLDELLNLGGHSENIDTNDPIAAAVRSIMGPEGNVNIKKSPVKQPPSSLAPHRPSPAVSLAASPMVPRPPLPQPPVLIRPQQARGATPGHVVPHRGPMIRGPGLPLPPPGVTSGRANIRYPVNHFSSMAVASPQQQQPPVKKIKTLNPSMGLSAPPENEPDPDPPAAVSAPENDIPIPARAPEKVAVRSPVLVKAKGPEGKQFHLNLSEESSDDETDGKGEKVKKVSAAERLVDMCKLSLLDHDYCYTAWCAAQPSEDLGDMEKLLSTVAMGGENSQLVSPPLAMMPMKPDERLLLPQEPVAPSKLPKKHKKNKKKKKKKKKKKQRQGGGSSSSSDSDNDIDVTGASGHRGKASRAGFVPNVGPKAQFHTPGASTGVTAGTGRPAWSSSSDDESTRHPPSVTTAGPSPVIAQATPPPPSGRSPRKRKSSRSSISDSDDSAYLNSSDLDTDFEADELLANLKQIQSKTRKIKPTTKAREAREVEQKEMIMKPTLKLKIKLPPGAATSLPSSPALPKKMSLPTPTATLNKALTPGVISTTPTGRPRMINTSLKKRKLGTPASAQPPVKKTKKKSPSAASQALLKNSEHLSKKMRESLALNRPDTSSSSSESFDNEDENEEDSSDDERNLKIDVGTKHQPQALAPVVTSAAAASSNPSDKLYCVCQCPHDDVSEMIGCDNPDCTVEWFHFECMGIMIPPEGKWYCPECTKKYGRKIRK